MKNGIFNIIRGIAFCFVLSIICLFGRVDIFAHTDNEIIDNFNKITVDIEGNYFVYSNEYTHKFTLCKIVYGNVYVKDDDSCISIKQDDNKLIRYDSYTCSYGSSKFDYFGQSQYQSNLTLNTNYKLVYSSFPIYYESGGLYNKYLIKQEESTPKYDSTLGYLKNCVVKRGTNSPKDWKSYSEFFTHNMDYFSWDSLTTTSREVKKVEYKLYFYNGSSVVHKENSFIESSRAGTYATSKTVFWNTFTDINWKDILIDKNAHYEIWFRPCEDNLYGDWCYFDISLPSWLTRFLNSYNENDGDIMSCFLYWIENGLDILGDGFYDLGQCTYAEKEGVYEPSENLDTNHSFSNVVNSYVVNYIDNSDNSVDDVTNIIESLPPSTNSYTEIINNITVIQNGNEDGSSLLDKFGDLLSFCKNFLTFIYNFINLILSPLSFLPGWLKSLLSMSIIAFIVICVIKTLRG